MIYSNGTVVSPDTDITNAKVGSFLPIIPDVSLQVLVRPQLI
jgi:hypothetical protein